MISRDGVEPTPDGDAGTAITQKPAGLKEPAVVVNVAAPARQVLCGEAFVDARNGLNASRLPMSYGAGAESAPDASGTMGEQSVRPTESEMTLDAVRDEIDAILTLGVQESTTKASQRLMSDKAGAESAPETDETTHVSKKGRDAERISTAGDVNDAPSPLVPLYDADAAQPVDVKEPRTRPSFRWSRRTATWRDSATAA